MTAMLTTIPVRKARISGDGDSLSDDDSTARHDSADEAAQDSGDFCVIAGTIASRTGAFAELVSIGVACPCVDVCFSV